MSIEESIKKIQPSIKLIPRFPIFIVVKVWGVAFAAWSWWWLLLPAYPGLYLILGRLGLLK